MSSLAATHEIGPIKLPPPQWERAAPLFKLLTKRSSSRDFSPQALPLEVLSTLLWAAFAINRRPTGGRTAPSAHAQLARNRSFRSAGGRRIPLRLGGARPAPCQDGRSATAHGGTGLRRQNAARLLDLVYVADFAKMGDATDEQRTFFASADAAVIAQNVYLFCACTDLATVVRGPVDRRKLAPALGLAARERIVLAQTVGYPVAKLT